MLVGEVRCAISGRGSAWKLSGGSQLSCDLGPGIGLEVVGRKPVVLGAREDLEEVPCAPRKTAQERAVASLQFLDRQGDGPADPRRDRRREEPQGKKRRGAGQCGGMGQENEHGQQQGRRGRDPHGAPVAEGTGGTRMGDLRRGRPLEQPPARDVHPPERPADGIHRHDGLVKHERDRERPSPRVIELPPQSAAHGAAPPPAREARDEVGEQVGARRGDGQQRPEPGRAREKEPAYGGQKHEPRRDQAAAEVVRDAPAVEQIEPAGQACALRAGDPRAEPGKDLPVAANPAMAAPRIAEVVGREVLVEDDVAGQSGAPVQALEEIVAENDVLRRTPFDGPPEGGDVVGALSGEDAFSEQVLVHVRDRAAVDVDRGIARVEPGEQRPRACLGRNLDPRLDEGVAFRHPVARAEFRVVQGMQERAEQPMRGAGRKDRVRVDRDDGGRADQAFRVARMHREGRAVSAGEEIVELRQLAALALPASPESIGRVTGPSAVEEHEGPVAGVAVVQTVDAGAQRGDDLRVRRQRLFRSIREIAQHDKAQVRVGIGQPVRLDMVEKRADLAGTAEDHRDRDGRADPFGQTCLEVELGKRARRQDQGNEPVGQGDRQDACRDQRQKDTPGVAGWSGANLPQHAQRQQERREAEQAQHREVEGPGARPDPLQVTGGERGPVAKRVLKVRPAGPDQPVAHMAAPRIVRLRNAHLQRKAHHLGFHPAAAAPEVLDGLAVEVAAFEIHPGIDAGRIAAERGVDEARVVEEVLPGKRGQRGDRGDRPRDGLGRVHAHRPAAACPDVHRRLEGGEQLCTGRDQRLEAHQPQHRGQGPKLGDRQFTSVLVGRDERCEPIEPGLHLDRVQRAAGDEPDPRQAAEPGRGEPRQVAVEARGHVLAHGADCPAQDVVVVDQPFRSLGGLRRCVGRTTAQSLEPRRHRVAARKQGQRPGRPGFSGMALLQVAGLCPRGIERALTLHAAQARPPTGVSSGSARPAVADGEDFRSGVGRTIRSGLPRWVTRKSATLPSVWSAYPPAPLAESTIRSTASSCAARTS